MEVCQDRRRRSVSDYPAKNKAWCGFKEIKQNTSWQGLRRKRFYRFMTSYLFLLSFYLSNTFLIRYLRTSPVWTQPYRIIMVVIPDYGEAIIFVDTSKVCIGLAIGKNSYICCFRLWSGGARTLWFCKSCMLIKSTKLWNEIRNWNIFRGVPLNTKLGLFNTVTFAFISHRHIHTHKHTRIQGVVII